MSAFSAEPGFALNDTNTSTLSALALDEAAQTLPADPKIRVTAIKMLKNRFFLIHLLLILVAPLSLLV